MLQLCYILPLLASFHAPVANAAAHYTGYEHGPGVPSASVGLDIILGVEDADSGDRGADYHQFLNSLAHRPRPMVPFQWYPYKPHDHHSGGEDGGVTGGGTGVGGAGGAGGHFYKPSRWPEDHGAAGGSGAEFRPEGAHKPTVLYLEGDEVPGVEGRPNRPGLLPDPQARPDRPEIHDRPGHHDRPGGHDRPFRPGRPDRPGFPERPERPERPQRPLSPPVDAFICPDHHSCSDEVWDRRDTRQSLSWSDRGCFCDAECRRYGDCCRDADALKDGEEEGDDTDGEDEEAGTETPLRLTAVGEDTEEGKEQEEEKEELECRSAPTLSSLGSTSADKENWYMMSACPREFDRYDNKVRCEVPSSASEDPLSALPVTSVTSNTTYSSLYCAMCHNDTADIAFWQLALRCPDIKANEPTQQQLLDRLRRTRTGWGLELDSGRRLHCELIARPPTTVRARPCRALRNHCSRSSPLHEACGNHTAVVYVAGQPFRNVYCAQCAGARPGQVTCSAPCASPRRPADIGGLRMRLTIAPGEDERCGETEIRDPFSRRCRSVICSRPGYDLVDGECVRTARDEDEVEDDREDRENGEEPGQLTDPEDNFLPAEGLLDTENAIEVELEEALAQAAAVEGEDPGEEAPEVELAELLAAEATTEAEDEQQGSGEAAEAVEDEDEEKETDA